MRVRGGLLRSLTAGRGALITSGLERRLPAMRRDLIGMIGSGVVHAGIIAIAMGRGHPSARRIADVRSISISVVDQPAAPRPSTDPLPRATKDRAPESPPPPAARSSRPTSRLATPEGLPVSIQSIANHTDTGVLARDERTDQVSGQPTPFIAVARLDRIRALPDAEEYFHVVDETLGAASWGACLRDTTGLDLYRDFDVLLTASPLSGEGARTPRTVALLLHGTDDAEREWRARDGGSGATVEGAGSAPCAPVRVFRPAPGILAFAGPADEPGEPSTDAGLDAGVPARHRWDDVVGWHDTRADPVDVLIVARALNSERGSSLRSGRPRPPSQGLPRALWLTIRAAPKPIVELAADCGDEGQANVLDADWPVSRGNPFLLIRRQGQVFAPTVGVDSQAAVLRASASFTVLSRALEMLVGFAAASGAADQAEAFSRPPGSR
jgi:hypothetical protein